MENGFNDLGAQCALGGDQSKPDLGGGWGLQILDFVQRVFPGVFASTLRFTKWCLTPFLLEVMRYTLLYICLLLITLINKSEASNLIELRDGHYGVLVNNDQHRIAVWRFDYGSHVRVGKINFSWGKRTALEDCIQRVMVKIDNVKFVEVKFEQCMAGGGSRTEKSDGRNPHFLSLDMPVSASKLTVELVSSHGNANIKKTFSMPANSDIDATYNAFKESYPSLFYCLSCKFLAPAPDKNNVSLRIIGNDSSYLDVVAACSSTEKDHVQKILLQGRFEEGSKKFETWVTVTYVSLPLSTQFEILLDMNTIRKKIGAYERDKAFEGDKDVMGVIRAQCVRGDKIIIGEQTVFPVKPRAFVNLGPGF